MTATILEVTDSTFDASINSPKPTLVDFWAPWCAPCKAMLPVLEEIAADYADKIQVVKINIDENPDTPGKFGIRGIPTLLLFKNGELEATNVGAVNKSKLTAFIDSNL